MDLRELPDLDLAALVGGLHELALFGGATSLCPEVFGFAARYAVSEVIARRAGKAPPACLFSPLYSVQVVDLKRFREAITRCVIQLSDKDFVKAAELLAERAACEVPVDVSIARPQAAGVELRTLN